MERFRRFLYLRKASYGSRGVNFMEDKKERVISLDSFERWRERLKGVHLHTGPYEELLDKHDSQDSFFYLDPPYPGHWQGEEHGFTPEQWDRLIDRLKRLKGKFILSLFRDMVETLPSGWHTRRVKTRRALGQDNVGRVLHHYEYLAANFPIDTSGKNEEAEEALARIGHQPFGSQAGKTRLASRIVKMIPPHETYVEPFAGGAAVFWAKEPAEKEVLNDKDPEIAFAYRFIKGLTEEQLQRLRRYDWRRTKPLFQKLKESKPSDDVERFRKFYYLAKASFGESRQTFGNEGADIDVDKLPAASERLKNVTILSQDFEPVVQRFDSADTFFYLDPPYPGRSFKGEFQFGLEDLERLVHVLKDVKGRFILSLGAEHRKYLPVSWWTKRVLVRRMLWLPQTDKRLSPNYELLAANFTPSRESLEALEAEADGAPDEEMVKFPETTDFMVVPDFISLVGSAVTGEAPEDLDILVRSAVRSESLEVAIRKQLDPEKQGYLHFIYEPAGPHDDYVPLWDLVALKKPEIEVVEVGLSKGLAPGKPFTPLKTAGGYGELEFSVDAADKLWETWGQGYADVGLVV
ncbi:MAG: DNA adenine methylase [Chloroflexi bacterium]|nr:DNA adenine methylase [Chloroflexota bacterium]